MNQKRPSPTKVPREVSDTDLPKPQSCRLAGLECRPCVQQAAVNLAAICPSLSPPSLRASFFKIYPDEACVPMARAFGRAYRLEQSAAEEEPAPADDDPSAEFETLLSVASV